MALEKVCSPAVIYVAFSLTHILIDIFKNLYNAAFTKFIIMFVFSILLNILCERGLGVISWLIVFIPFITMTLLSSLILVVFGLSPFTGKLGEELRESDEINKIRSEPNAVNLTQKSKMTTHEPEIATSDYTLNIGNQHVVTDEVTAKDIIAHYIETHDQVSKMSQSVE
tara:strand:+ start:99 stop:605 length:507 start_codon:yes stop_codon:yes gene_type:complete